MDIDQGADGATWYSGSGVPGGSLGAVGDWYFRTDNGYVYQKTGATTWTFRRDITGPPGPATPATVGDGSITTGKIALSATASVYAAANSASRSLAASETTLLSVSPPGGEGFNVLIQGFVKSLANSSSADGVLMKLKRGSTQLTSLRGSSGRDGVGAITASIQHPSNAFIALTAEKVGEGGIRYTAQRIVASLRGEEMSAVSFLWDELGAGLFGAADAGEIILPHGTVPYLDERLMIDAARWRRTRWNAPEGLDHLQRDLNASAQPKWTKLVGWRNAVVGDVDVCLANLRRVASVRISAAYGVSDFQDEMKLRLRNGHVAAQDTERDRLREQYRKARAWLIAPERTDAERAAFSPTDDKHWQAG